MFQNVKLHSLVEEITYLQQVFYWVPTAVWDSAYTPPCSLNATSIPPPLLLCSGDIEDSGYCSLWQLKGEKSMDGL